jgi:hypothetical protein
MARKWMRLSVASVCVAHGLACSDASSSSNTSQSTGGTTSSSGGAAGTDGGGSPNSGGSTSTAGSGGQGGAGGSAAGAPNGTPTCEELPSLIAAYKTANSGNGGKDWDLLAKTPAEILADPAAAQLISICGEGQLPVIPELAWEYGGSDHAWVNPEASALAYCVYIPVSPSSEHWQYDPTADHVTADVYVKCPDQNPCNDEQGADQVMACLGDPSNIEIIVDTASLNDGADAGLSLSEATTDLNLITSGGETLHLYTGL